MAQARTDMSKRMQRWLRERPDDHLLQWLFRAMVALTIAVVGLDYYEMSLRAEAYEPAANPGIETEGTPLPPMRRDGDEGPLRKADGKLKNRMAFDLAADGRLLAVGRIDPGTAETFATEIEKRGGYVKTVVLSSPGGSVADALKMGRLIRAKGFATEVESGGYCASSCPLVFAGGVERRAGAKAALGVHQIFAGTGHAGGLGEGMNGAQRASAECQRYLREMGVDLEVWVHAMETPKERLYYFKPDEMLALKLATQHAGRTASPKAGS